VLFDYFVLCVMAVLAGAINAIAGGGTLLTFPALVSVLGSSPDMQVVANATNTVALCPGSATGAWGYRRELEQSGRWAVWLLPPSIVGGLVGSLLLAWLPPETFAVLVPWLILSATLIFLLQPQIARWTGIGRPHPSPSGRRVAGVMVFQFFVAVYGGYFGAGIGILMLSALAVMGLSDIHAMNALKTLLATAINAVAIVVFAIAGTVSWPHAVPMIISGMVGGYLGASVARKLNREVVRRIVVAIGFVLSAIYFYEQWQG
jgi:uncharacterized membrane protein YfcA